MQRTTLSFIALVMGLVLFCHPASAQSFSTQDLNGSWSMHALGVYDVRGIYYYGTLTVEGGLITGDAGGAQGYAVADYTGGGFSLSSTGEIQGIIQGRSSQGDITICINMGWMGTDKNQISFIGTDQDGMVLMVTLVKAD